MYKTGIKKFPECTNLRISYAFFHLERTKNKDKAYEEFAQASKTDPSFEQQFNIYRFRKIIRENLEDKEENNSDLIEMIRFDNHVSLCEEAMMKSAKLHKDFWTELKEEMPDLRKLNSVGSQITETSNAVKENYTELSKINSSAFEVLYSYAMYLIYIIEDYTEGKELLSNARKIYQDRLIGGNKADIDFEIESLNKSMAPILLVSGKEATFGRVNGFNVMFTEVTGFRHEELVEQDLGKMMPKLFLNYSTNFMSLLSTKSEALGGGSKDEDAFKEGFVLHKLGHVIPIEYSINFNQAEEEFRIVIRQSISTNLKIVLLANSHGEVTDFSLLGLHCFKDKLEENNNGSEYMSSVCTLANLGIQDYEDLQYQKPSGCIRKIELNHNATRCQIHIAPYFMKVFDGSFDEN